MAFLLMKLVKPFFLPPTLLLVGMLAAWWGVHKGRRWGSRLLLCTALVYYLLSIGPTAQLLLGSLEHEYTAPSTLPAADSVDAIVVLAGGAAVPRNNEIVELSGSSWRRLWKGIEITRSYNGNVPMLYSGGSGDPFQTTSYEARRACEIAAVAGVGDSCFIEDGSRTTAESGEAVVEWLRKRIPAKKGYSIILVTSAFHMPRSVRVMESQELDVVPEPTDYYTRGKRQTPMALFPQIEYFSQSTQGLHERLGMVWYRVSGRIK
ncbi:YdcF family protein [Candidatus Uhrbacteria bacterium]|nr:YdcF family protein [Candidatus Uhrbacteria bacterium]